MKIDKRTLKQIVKEEIHNVLQEQSPKGTALANLKKQMTALNDKRDSGKISQTVFDKISKDLREKFKEEQRAEDANLDKFDTLAGPEGFGPTAAGPDNPDANLDKFDTLAGPEGFGPTLSPEQQAQLDQMGTAAPQQDAANLSVKYEKVKQILSKLVSEL